QKVSQQRRLDFASHFAKHEIKIGHDPRLDTGRGVSLNQEDNFSVHVKSILTRQMLDESALHLRQFLVGQHSQHIDPKTRLGAQHLLNDCPPRLFGSHFVPMFQSDRTSVVELESIRLSQEMKVLIAISDASKQ